MSENSQAQTGEPQAASVPVPAKTEKPAADKDREKKAGFAWRGLKMGGRFNLFNLLSGRLMSFILLLAFVLLRFYDPEPLRVMRAKTFDLFQTIKPRAFNEQTPVTVIDIDEQSLAEIGQWPWPRTTLADLVMRLRSLGAVVVAFDAVFAEPDRMSPANVALALPLIDDDTRARLSSLPSNDDIFAQTITGQNVVVGITGTSDLTAKGIDIDPPQPASLGMIGLPREEIIKWMQPLPALVHNVPALDRAAAGRGMFNVTEDVDGIIRRVPTVLRIKDTVYPSLALEALRVASGVQTILLRARGQLGIQDLVLKRDQAKLVIRTDENGNIWPYFRKYDRRTYVSVAEIMAGTAPLEKIQGKILFVGTSAVGLKDIRSTPLDRFLPGVELHAQIIENILGDTQLTRPREANYYETLAALGAGLLMIILVPLAGARLTLVLFLTVSGGLIGGAWYYFSQELTLYDPGFPVLTALLLYIMLTYSSYAKEEAQRRQVRGAFSRYMSPALVERLAKDPTQLKLGGEMRDMTLLFCDVRGFTTISEQFDAEGLTKLINKFLTPMTDVILNNRGTIDKYMGDCIMAFWNAPLDDEDHARHACESALTMFERLGPVNDQLEIESKEEGRKHVPIRIGAGLNSGMACVGNMGSDQRFDYSVLGDTVNLASRLEGQSKTYGVDVVIGDITQKKATDYATVEMDLIKVKGKTEPVRIHALLGRPDMAATPEFQAYRKAHDEMLALYRAQKWDEMEAKIAECRVISDALKLALHGHYELYEERAAYYREHSPGEDWDGVFVATSK